MLSDGVMARLAEVGFDPVFGARPLKRAIQQQLENPLAQRLLRGEFVPGQQICAELEGEKLIFKAATLQ